MVDSSLGGGVVARTIWDALSRSEEGSSCGWCDSQVQQGSQQLEVHNLMASSCCSQAVLGCCSVEARARAVSFLPEVASLGNAKSHEQSLLPGPATSHALPVCRLLVICPAVGGVRSRGQDLPRGGRRC